MTFSGRTRPGLIEAWEAIPELRARSLNFRGGPAPASLKLGHVRYSFESNRETNFRGGPAPASLKQGIGRYAAQAVA